MSARPDVAGLRHRLALQRPVDIPDAIGGFERQWETVSLLWAAIETTGAQSRFEAARSEARITHRITIRWRPDVSSSMRLVGNDGVFDIIAAHDADGRRAFMACYCEQVQS